VTLGATASSGSIVWFSAPTGGFSIGGGATYTTPVISATTTYYVAATGSGCTTPSRTAVVATVHSIGECGSRSPGQGGGVNDEPESVRVFPNPNDGAFSVVIPVDQKAAVISVIDVAGREVVTQTVSDNDGSPIMVKLNQVATGMYFVKINAGQYSTVVRLVIQ